MPVSYETLRAQLEAILGSWGMDKNNAELTAEVMAWADLHGIDSHGISMITVYHQRLQKGLLNITARPKIQFGKPPYPLSSDGMPDWGTPPHALP